MWKGLEIDRYAAQEGVQQVAFKALSSLAPANDLLPNKRKPLESFLSQMFDAVLAAHPAALSEVIKGMRRARIPGPVIAEVYVPVIARRLGDAWVADTLDFGAVTIGSARLQGLLRKLERDWAVPVMPLPKNPPAFLVGVGQGQQHTLGAAVLAGQLRHRGMSVNLDLELTSDSLVRHVLDQELSGVLLSAAACDDLASLREFVCVIRQHGRITPVFIGGSILTQSVDIKIQPGADLVTQGVENVLNFCDIRTVAQDDTFALEQEVK